MRKYAILLIALAVLVFLFWTQSGSDRIAQPLAPLDRLVADLGCPERNQASCLRETLYRTLESEGTSAAQVLLHEWSASIAPQPFPCHAIAHFLGRAVYERDGSSGFTREGLVAGPENCRDGYLHGLLEGLGLSADRADLVPILDTACAPFESDAVYARWCTHALGHAASMAEQDSLPAALDLCADLRTSSRSDCVGGVLMTFGGRTLAFDWSQEEFDLETGDVIFVVAPATRASVCPTLPADTQLGCWEYLWMLYDDEGVFEEDFPAYRAACEYATTPAAADLCGQGMGKLVLNAIQFDAAGDLLTYCAGPAAVQAACEYGIVASFVGAHHASAGSFESYESVCIKLTGDLRTRCQKAEDTARSQLE